MFAEAAAADRSLIFTFAPEASVAPDFPARARALAEAAGGDVMFAALAVLETEQERRLTAPSRAAFGKLQSLDLLRQLRGAFDAAMAAMPKAAITIDTTTVSPSDAAAAIAARCQLTNAVSSRVTVSGISIEHMWPQCGIICGSGPAMPPPFRCRARAE